MKFEEYQQLAMRTSPDGHDRIANGCMGLIGETGEIVDLVKKWEFQSGDHAELPREKLIEECGDLLWYCAELATGLEKDLAAAYMGKSSLFDDVRKINRESPITITAMRLAMIAVRPAQILFDAIPSDTDDEASREYLKASVLSNIVGIMSGIRDFLEFYCRTSLLMAMERNIEKLQRRYPDGFDPERSLHRE